MTRARRHLRRGDAVRHRRWREQATRLIVEACWPDPGDRVRRVLSSPVDGPVPMHFDLARVREHCQRLISEADALDLQREVFADWTRERGMGPENREPGQTIERLRGGIQRGRTG